MGFSHQHNSPETNGVFLFGDFELSPKRGTLTRNGEEIPLRRQCFDVLIYLIRHQGVLVTKQELMDAVWPDVVVTDSSVPQCICTIRRALGDDSKTLIRSMPRSGYLFDAPVQHHVIPADNNAFSHQLLQFTGIRKFSRAVLITLALAVFVLLGLRSTVGEKHEEPETVVTSNFLPEHGFETFHETLIEFARDEDTPVAADNTGHEAQKHFKLGKYYYGRRAPGDLLLAVDEFRSAVSFDPQFADAWVGLAAALRVMYLLEGFRPSGNHEEYVSALRKALEIDPYNPEANARIARYYQSQGKRQLARQHSDRALKSGGDNALVLAFAAGQALEEGLYADAASLQQRAVALEPLSTVYQINLAHYLKMAGRLDDAIMVYQTALDLAHGNEEDAIEGLFRCYFLQGRYDQAEAYASQLRAAAARYQSFALLDIARHRENMNDELIGRLSQLSGADSALRLAEVYAYAGDAVAAFHWLDKALDEPFAMTQNSNSYLDIHTIKYSVLLRPIIADDRWLAWQSQVEKQGKKEG